MNKQMEEKRQISGAEEFQIIHAASPTSRKWSITPYPLMAGYIATLFQGVQHGKVIDKSCRPDRTEWE